MDDRTDEWRNRNSSRASVREKERLSNVYHETYRGSQYGAVLRLSLSLTPFTLSRVHAHIRLFSFIVFHLAFVLASLISVVRPSLYTPILFIRLFFALLSLFLFLSLCQLRSHVCASVGLALASSTLKLTTLHIRLSPARTKDR